MGTGLKWLKERRRLKIWDMGGHGDENNKKYLKIYKVVKKPRCPLKTFKKKCNYLECFWPVREGITLLTWKIKILLLLLLLLSVYWKTIEMPSNS